MSMEAKPFVKWAGGKRSLIPQIEPLLPKKCRTYYEPFVGGGALFFHLSNQGFFKKAVLNDTNSRLMSTYAAVKFNAELLIKKLKKMPNEKEVFLRMREKLIDAPSMSNVDRAAWLIYLNKTCFNGLYRVNKAGKFNVPFGDYKNPNICDEDNLWLCSAALKGVNLRNENFTHCFSQAKAGDFVFCDPPYLPRVHNGEFTKYDSSDFGYIQHEILANAMRALKKRGVHVMITNSGTDEVRILYKGFTITESKGARSVGSTGERRGHVQDFIITN